jgi:hypothetical protein
VLVVKHEVVEEAINGTNAEIVASSWIEALGGLSQ